MITLTVALKTAVPFWVDEYKRKGGPGKKDYERIKETAELLGEKGDRLLYKGDETALIFNEVAESIAILSFLPGGIDIFGEHWKSELKGIL